MGERTMPDMAEPPEFLRILRSRIRERMAEERLSARDVSLQAKLGSSAVSDILLGRNKSPSLSALAAIAATLKTDLAFLTGKRDNFALATELSDTVRRIPIVGTVEAGS